MLADGAVFAMMFDQPVKAAPVELAGQGVVWSELGGHMPLSLATGFIGRYQLGNQAIRINKQALAQPTAAITVEMVITVPSSFNNMRAISCTEAGGWNFQGAATSLQWSVYKTSAGYITAVIPVASLPAAGQLAHIVGVYDGSNVIAYVNGAEAARVDNAGVSPIKYNSTASIYIGAEATSGSVDYSNNLNGASVCATGIYPTALTPTQIAAHAALCVPKAISGIAKLDDGSAASRVLVRHAETLLTVADLTPDPDTGEWSTVAYPDVYDVVTYGPEDYRPAGDYPIQPI